MLCVQQKQSLGGSADFSTSRMDSTVMCTVSSQTELHACQYRIKEDQNRGPQLLAMCAASQTALSSKLADWGRGHVAGGVAHDVLPCGSAVELLLTEADARAVVSPRRC